MRRHRQWVAGVVAAAAAFGAAGCATRQVRGANALAPDGVYPAVRVDCQVVSACFGGGTGFHERGGLAKVLGYTVVPLCWVLDTPISAVTDTVCLPSDWRRVEKDKPEPLRAPEAAVP